MSIGGKLTDPSIKLRTRKLPDSPGVYFFLNKSRKIIYIGKATSLRDRVRSYFSSDIEKTRGPLIVKMLNDAVSIDYKKTDSVLEALLLEADLIKKFKPQANVLEKDDKSFNCIVITKEDFPQILTIRKKEINFSSLSTANYKLASIFGPFTNGTQLKEALKIIRKIFPYRDNKCKIGSKRSCFNYSIGLCPGTCIGIIDKHCYAIRIKRIKQLLSGNVRGVVRDLEKDMKNLAKEKDFEGAKILRDKIYALQHINDISLIKFDSSTLHTPHSTLKIESYDIAHMAGKEMVGVFTVVEGGVSNKSLYRKFNIKGFDSANDTGALREVLERRFKHDEWSSPDLIVVDGGVAQLNCAKDVLNELKIKIPVVAVVKNERHKPKGILGDEILVKKYKKEILLGNSEAHRFAVAFHKKKRNQKFLS